MMTARRMILGPNSYLPEFIESSPDELLLQAPGGLISKRKNVVACRTLGRRCLRIQEGAIAPAPVADIDVPVDPPTTVDLPTLPTDPESSTWMSPPPPAERTNPSSLLTPGTTSSDPRGVSVVPGKSSSPGLGSNMASTVGIGAGAGVTGLALLILGLLYYFKPDIFLCCKTCVRVQIFHHTTASSKK